MRRWVTGPAKIGHIYDSFAQDRSKPFILDKGSIGEKQSGMVYVRVNSDTTRRKRWRTASM